MKKPTIALLYDELLNHYNQKRNSIIRIICIKRYYQSNYALETINGLFVESPFSLSI